MDRRLASVIAAVAAAGVAVFAAGLTQATSDDIKALLVLMVLGALAERYAIGLFSSYVSVGASAMLVAALIGGLWGVALVAPALVLAGDFRTPSAWYKRAYNIGVYLLSGAAFWGVFRLFDQPATPAGWPEVLGPATAGALANYAVNAGLVALAIALQKGTPIPWTFRENYLWLLPQYLIVGLAATAAATAYLMLGLWGFAVFAAPVAGIRHAYSLGAKAAPREETELPKAA